MVNKVTLDELKLLMCPFFYFHRETSIMFLDDGNFRLYIYNKQPKNEDELML